MIRALANAASRVVNWMAPPPEEAPQYCVQCAQQRAAEATYGLCEICHADLASSIAPGNGRKRRLPSNPVVAEARPAVRRRTESPAPDSAHDDYLSAKRLLVRVFDSYEEQQCGHLDG